MRYSLRTLLMLLVILPPLIWLGWTKYQAWRDKQNDIQAHKTFDDWRFNGLRSHP